MKNFKTKKALFSLVLLSMLIQMFVVSPFTNVKADASNQIVKDLEIVGKTDNYAPGEIIKLEGNWALPDDSENGVWSEGDSFSISVPEGLTYVGGKIKLGDYGVGELVGDKIVFTFSKTVDQKIDRHGGFNLRFTIDEPKDGKDLELDLDFKDENNNTILKDSINVVIPEAGVTPGNPESFSKGDYRFQTEEGIRWFIRVNKDGEIKDSSVKLTDRLGENQILDVDSFKIKQIPKGEASASGVEYVGNLSIDEDLMGFSIDLDVTNHWYDIDYKTIYTGDYGDGGTIMLENSATLKGDSGETIPMDDIVGKTTAEAEFDLGGWGKGDQKYGSLVLNKVDSVTKEGLKGAKFKLSHKVWSDKVYIVETDENGIGEINSLLSGVYSVEEIEVPEGYERMNNEIINVKFDENSKFEYVVENVRKPIEITGSKQWFDADGKEIESQEAIVLELLQDGKVIRKTVLPKGEYEFTFKNLDKFDKDGNEIKYIVNEVEMDGYEKTELINKDGEVVVINKLKPVEPEIPEPEEPVTYINITGEKQWFDAEGKEIESQESIEIELLQDGKVIKKQVLPKGEYKFSFNDLLEFDEDGNRINYSINEVNIDGYKKAEILKQEDNTVLIVNQQNELPVEPETPEPEEPVKPVEPETPEPEEPVKPVEPETPEPEEPGELIPPASEDPIIEEGVLSVNKVPSTRPSDKEVLPQTGMSANYLGYVISAAGLALTVLAKKKD